MGSKFLLLTDVFLKGLEAEMMAAETAEKTVEVRRVCLASIVNPENVLRIMGLLFILRSEDK